jgi:hypothetical protein
MHITKKLKIHQRVKKRKKIKKKKINNKEEMKIMEKKEQFRIKINKINKQEKRRKRKKKLNPLLVHKAIIWEFLLIEYLRGLKEFWKVKIYFNKKLHVP